MGDGLARTFSEDLFADENGHYVQVAEVEALTEEDNVVVGPRKRRARNSRGRRIGRATKRRKTTKDHVQEPTGLMANLGGDILVERQEKIASETFSDVDVDRTEENVDNRQTYENLEVVEINLQPKRKSNKKRKSQKLTKKKGDRARKKPSKSEEVTFADVLDTSVVHDIGDGDDHQEYGYINNSPEFKSSDNQTFSSQQSALSMEDFPSEASAVEALVYYLHHSLKESGSKWQVDSRGDMCRLTLLTDHSNVAVERAVVWSSNDGTQVFLNNNQLPKDNFILTIPQPEESSLSDLAQYLQILTTLVESVKVCEGVTTYYDSWTTAEELGLGNIDRRSPQGLCFRSSDCTVVHMESKRCDACECNRVSFKQKKWRDAQAKKTDLSKMNNRYLLRKALLAKTKSLAAQKKSAGKTIRYYKKRVRQMIKAESILVDQHLSKDFFDIMKQNVTKMTPVQKLFWSEQVKAISKQSNPRTIRWNPMMIKIALHLQSLSPTAYEYLRESGLVQLPSQRRLYDFSHFTQAKEGIQHVVLELLSERLDKIITEDYQRYFNLLFDEMNIQSGLVVTKSGDIVGFVNLNEIEQSVADLENELSGEGEVKKKEAKKVLVFMLQGVSLDVNEVVAIFPTTELSAEQLYTRAWDVIFNLESHNMKILTLIGDGAGCNKKFFKMHAKYDHSQEFVYCTRNIASGEDRPIFFIIDPPHLLKTIRNCFSNSYGHNYTRTMWKDGEVISWAAIEMLLHASIQDKFKKHKLTWAHVKLTAFTRMNVKYATQTMSDSSSISLSDYKDDERFNGLVTSQLLMFLRVVNKFFDCLNGSNDPDGKRNKSNKNLLPYTSVNEERLTTTLKGEVLQFFQDWQRSVENREGDFTAEDKERMTISSQSYESLHITIFGFCGAVKYLLDCGAPSIDAKKFNQDKLEQYFGILRMCGGASNNPSLQGVLQKSLALTVQKGAALPGKKGNTKGTRQLVVNEEPLPCRPGH